MLEDTDAVKNTKIKIERINEPFLVISGKNDEQWPATSISNQIMERLKKNNFKHYYEHIVLDGGI